VGSNRGGNFCDIICERRKPLAVVSSLSPEPEPNDLLSRLFRYLYLRSGTKVPDDAGASWTDYSAQPRGTENTEVYYVASRIHARNDEPEIDFGLARKSGAYVKQCRPMALQQSNLILVQVSAIDTSKKGQLYVASEMLLDQYEFTIYIPQYP
jgi:hypothetical protein